MEGNRTRIYEFGPFRLYPDQKMLFRGDRRLDVDRKALAVLDVLVQNKGQLVTKDRLLTEVWTDVSVEEGNIGVHVSRIRRVLGDERQQSEYIQTIHGEGYRFVAKVTETLGQIYPSGGKAANTFLEFIALSFALEAGDAFVRGEVWWKWIGSLLLSVVFLWAGIKWSQMEPKVWPRLALLLERLSNNRLYRVIYAAITILLLVSVSLSVYGRFHAGTIPVAVQPALITASKPVISKHAMGDSELVNGAKYIWIQPGTFIMGCSPQDAECDVEEKPSHQVTLTRGFWIGQTEVTQGQYRKFRQPEPLDVSDPPNDDLPVVNVKWKQAQQYCIWAGGALPTEAQWEYAARGGAKGARYNDIDKVAWYEKTSEGKTHEVGQLLSNGYGLFDMLGNTFEWVNDWYAKYSISPVIDPIGPSTGTDKIVRGGAWITISRYVRVSNRRTTQPDKKFAFVGFRCVEPE